jgi:hypothetical protein
MPLTDYFRAADPDLVVAAMRQDRPLIEVEGGPFDGLSAKGVDSSVVLGQLIGFVRDVPWSTGLVGSIVRWPPPETRPRTKEEWGAIAEDSPWATGPWLEELADDVRDTLAGVAGERLPELADRWAGIEEFRDFGPSAEDLLAFLDQFVALARRAVAAGDHLYCWMSL